MPAILLILFAFIVCFVGCSNTVSVNDGSEDNSEISSSSGKNDGGDTDSKSSSSGVNSENVEETEECTGESGIPWDGTTAKEFACGSGTKLSPYIILNGEQLARLSFIVGSNDKDYTGKYYKLGADILLNDGKVIDQKGALVADSTELHKWTPIGNSSVAFTGHFDGAGYKISGMFINTTSSHNGLFGNVSGSVSNLTVENSWVTGGKYTGGIVGYNTGNLKNLANKSSVTSISGSVGGVIGSSMNSYGKVSLIDSIFNFGVVKGKNDVGGVLGFIDRIKLTHAENYGLVEGEKYTGGIWGGAKSTTVEANNLLNRGNITGEEYVGGIAGYCGHYGVGSSYSAKCGSLKNVKNEGSIEGAFFVGGIAGTFGGSANSVSNTAIISGSNYIGGLFGNADFSTTTSLYNTGDVAGSKYVGGIIGYNKEGVTSSAYSTGSVDGDSLVGLMIGYNYNTTMADYYYLEQGDLEPFGENNGGGVATPKTASEMKTEDFAELVGEDFVYDSGLNDGYPVLSWEVE